MSVYLICSLWYLVGVIASVIAGYIEWKRSCDILLEDFFGLAVASFLGPVFLIIVICVYNSVSRKSVVIKGKKK